MEIEHIKIISIFVAAGASQILGSVAGASSDDMVSRWIERGGTSLCIILLITAVRTLRADGKELRAKLDENSAKDKELLEKSTESRVVLNNTMLRQCDAIDKLTTTIENLKHPPNS